MLLCGWSSVTSGLALRLEISRIMSRSKWLFCWNILEHRIWLITLNVSNYNYKASITSTKHPNFKLPFECNSCLENLSLEKKIVKSHESKYISRFDGKILFKKFRQNKLRDSIWKLAVKKIRQITWNKNFRDLIEKSALNNFVKSLNNKMSLDGKFKNILCFLFHTKK